MPRTPHALLGPIATHADAVDKEAGLQPRGSATTRTRSCTRCWAYDLRQRIDHRRSAGRRRPVRPVGAGGRIVRLVSARFEELDRRDTPMGEIVLRRRWEPALHVDVYEVKLGDEFLMSSLFTASEIALATLGLATFPDPTMPHRRRRRRTRPRLHRGRGARGHESGVAHGHRSVARGRRLARGSPAPVRPRSHRRIRAAGSRRATSSRWSRAMPAWAWTRPTGGTRSSWTSTTHRGTTCTPSHAPFYEPAGLRRLAHYLHPGGVFALVVGRSTGRRTSWSSWTTSSTRASRTSSRSRTRTPMANPRARCTSPASATDV